jgi:hypothetical protein
MNSLQTEIGARRDDEVRIFRQAEAPAQFRLVGWIARRKADQVRFVVDQTDTVRPKMGVGLNRQVAYELGVGDQHGSVLHTKVFDDAPELFARRQPPGQRFQVALPARSVGADGVVPEKFCRPAGEPCDVLEYGVPKPYAHVEFSPAPGDLCGQREPEHLAEFARDGAADPDHLYAFWRGAVLFGADKGHVEFPAALRGQIFGQAVAELFGSAVAAEFGEHQRHALHSMPS